MCMQFLLCLRAYVDKTAKNAGAGEPFLLSASAAPQVASQGTLEHMVCAGLPSWPGSWFVHKEAAVLSQIPNQGHAQSQLPQDHGCCPTRYSCHSEKGLQSFCLDGQHSSPDDGDTCHYFCKRQCQEWRYTHLSLQWQELHSQGTQDVLVWQSRSWQPAAQMPMDLSGLPESIEWKGGTAVGPTRDTSRWAPWISPSEESPWKGDEAIHDDSWHHVSSSLPQCLLWCQVWSQSIWHYPHHSLRHDTLHQWGGKHCLHQNHVLHHFFAWSVHQFFLQANKLL